MSIKCNINCQSAIGDSCICPCGGSQHGAKYRLLWILAMLDLFDHSTEYDIEDVNAHHKKRIEELNNKINKLLESKSLIKEKTTKNEIGLIVRYIKDIACIELLKKDKEISLFCYNVTKIVPAKYEESQLIRNLSTKGDKVQLKSVYKRYSDHYFCDFFASLAQLLESIKSTIKEYSLPPGQPGIDNNIKELRQNEIKNEKIYSKLINQRKIEYNTSKLSIKPETKTRFDYDIEIEKLLNDFQSLSSNLLDALINEAIIKELSIDELLYASRILGILFCPDPFKHKAVRDHCIKPIIDKILQFESNPKFLKRLTIAFFSNQNIFFD